MKKVLIALLLSLGLSASAWAYTLPLTLAVGPTVSGNITYGNFGTVNITNITGGVHFDFVANSGYYFGDGSMVGLNTISGTLTVPVSSITRILDSGATDTTAMTKGPNNNGIDYTGQNVNGFGTFNITISNDNFTNHESEVSFNLLGTDSSGNPLDASSVLTDNAKGFLVAAHIFADNPPVGVNTQTFYVANGDAPVPEPGTMMLLGAGFLSLAVYCKRRQNA